MAHSRRSQRALDGLCTFSPRGAISSGVPRGEVESRILGESAIGAEQFDRLIPGARTPLARRYANRGASPDVGHRDPFARGRG